LENLPPGSVGLLTLNLSDWLRFQIQHFATGKKSLESTWKFLDRPYI